MKSQIVQGFRYSPTVLTITNKGFPFDLDAVIRSLRHSTYRGSLAIKKPRRSEVFRPLSLAGEFAVQSVGDGLFNRQTHLVITVGRIIHRNNKWHAAFAYLC